MDILIGQNNLEFAKWNSRLGQISSDGNFFLAQKYTEMFLDTV